MLGRVQPSGFTEDPELMTIAVEVNAKPGTAILFHQGVYHTSTPNYRPYNRYIQHMIYSGPWLVRSGRTGSDPKWLEQTTERRRGIRLAMVVCGVKAQEFSDVKEMMEYNVARW